MVLLVERCGIIAPQFKCDFDVWKVKSLPRSHTGPLGYYIWEYVRPLIPWRHSERPVADRDWVYSRVLWNNHTTV